MIINLLCLSTKIEQSAVGVATCAFCLSVSITLISLLGLHGCTPCSAVHVASSPRQNLSWLLEPKEGGGGGAIFHRTTFIVQIGPPCDHYQPLHHDETAHDRILVCVFSGDGRGSERVCSEGSGGGVGSGL